MRDKIDYENKKKSLDSKPKYSTYEIGKAQREFI